MQAKIVNYRQGRHTQTDNQMIVSVDGVTARKDAQGLVGKKVTYTTSSGKTITGIIASAHGNSGAVRVRFERGMPGQSLSSDVSVQ